MPISERFTPEKIHAELGEEFLDLVEPANFPKLTMRHRDDAWAARVGLDGMSDAEWLSHFGEYKPLPGSFPKPMALRYHGHQFRTYNPDLGDGRGFLFAQMRDLKDQRLLDFGTKGSGQTPWSRQGDGRLTLKGGVREILATKLLEARGINTSKSFCLIETHEELMRSDEPSPTRSAVLTRLSHSHIRIGSFQRQAALGETNNIARLLDHCITHYMPECGQGDTAQRTLNFLRHVCNAVAETGAMWMHAGFVHGVLNTDNINITGESFDYGPWRFVPTCDPNFTAAYFDHQGLYAYARQVDALLWNLTRLAECLTDFAPAKDLEKVLEGFAETYADAFNRATLWRLGLKSNGADADLELTRALWNYLQKSQAPFEQFFFDFYGGLENVNAALSGPSAEFYKQSEFSAVRSALAGYQPVDPDSRKHVSYQNDRPVTLLIDEVEALWDPIAEHDDWSLFHAKLETIDQVRYAAAIEI